MDLAENEFLSAWTNLRVAQDRWLVADPLRFAGVEVSVPSVCGAPDEASAVEVEIITRPKPRGGVRAEVFPNVVASVSLQVIADRIAETLTDPGDSLSARLFGVRLRGENPYDVWGSAVASWLRSELEVGRVVIVCDLHDYFPSIRRPQVERALDAGHITEPLRGHCLRLLDAIHTDCKRQGRPTTGLPICPADFFWLVADLVLEPLDRDVRRIAGVSGYARWVDDLFVSTDSPSVEKLLQQIEAAAGNQGFQLNREKTKVFASLGEFRREFRMAEHDLVSHLFSTVDRGRRAPRVETLLHELYRGVVGPDVEEARLVKRLYGLAALIGTPMFVANAAVDLERFPTAERAILDYLGGQAWREPADGVATAAIERGPTDSRSILALRSLLNSPPPPKCPALLNRLEKLVLADDEVAHPYTRAIGIAVLAQHGSTGDFSALAAKLVSRVPWWGSSMARRVAYEFLLLAPGVRDRWAPAVANDSSALVRSLHSLFAGRETNFDRATLGALAEQRRPRRLAWGDVQTRVAREMLMARHV